MRRNLALILETILYTYVTCWPIVLPTSPCSDKKSNRNMIRDRLWMDIGGYCLSTASYIYNTIFIDYISWHAFLSITIWGVITHFLGHVSMRRTLIRKCSNVWGCRLKKRAFGVCKFHSVFCAFAFEKTLRDGWDLSHLVKPLWSPHHLYHDLQRRKQTRANFGSSFPEHFSSWPFARFLPGSKRSPPGGAPGV